MTIAAGCYRLSIFYVSRRRPWLSIRIAPAPNLWGTIRASHDLPEGIQRSDRPSTENQSHSADSQRAPSHETLFATRRSISFIYLDTPFKSGHDYV